MSDGYTFAALDLWWRAHPKSGLPLRKLLARRPGFSVRSLVIVLVVALITIRKVEETVGIREILGRLLFVLFRL